MSKNKAMDVAKAIFNEDTKSYLAAKDAAEMEKMSRRELLDFRSEVHRIVEDLKREQNE